MPITRESRFCDKIDAWIEHTVMNHRVAHISRRVKHVEIRTQFQGHFSQTATNFRCSLDVRFAPQ